MSFTVALANEAVRLYASLVFGLLAAFGLVLAVLGRVFHRDVGHVWAAWRGWAVVVPIITACVLLGRLATIGLVVCASALGFREFARATGLARDTLTTAVCVAGIVLLGLAVAIAPLGGVSQLTAFVPVAVIAVIVAIPVLRDRADGQLAQTSLAVFGFAYVGWMFGYVSWVASSPNAYAYLLFLLVSVELADVAGYAVGRTIGRHPLRPHVSPRKTWEGAAASLLLSLTLPWLLRFSLPGFSNAECVLAGLTVGIGGQIGDLTVSFVKRDLGIKDMGASIPGHGGVLDRIDSLAYAAPLFYAVTCLASAG